MADRQQKMWAVALVLKKWTNKSAFDELVENIPQWLYTVTCMTKLSKIVLWVLPSICDFHSHSTFIYIQKHIGRLLEVSMDCKNLMWQVDWPPAVKGKKANSHTAGMFMAMKKDYREIFILHTWFLPTVCSPMGWKNRPAASLWLGLE